MSDDDMFEIEEIPIKIEPGVDDFLPNDKVTNSSFEFATENHSENNCENVNETRDGDDFNSNGENYLQMEHFEFLLDCKNASSTNEPGMEMANLPLMWKVLPMIENFCISLSSFSGYYTAHTGVYLKVHERGENDCPISVCMVKMIWDYDEERLYERWKKNKYCNGKKLKYSFFNDKAWLSKFLVAVNEHYHHFMTKRYIPRKIVKDIASKIKSCKKIGCYEAAFHLPEQRGWLNALITAFRVATGQLAVVWKAQGDNIIVKKAFIAKLHIDLIQDKDFMEVLQRAKELYELDKTNKSHWLRDIFGGVVVATNSLGEFVVPEEKVKQFLAKKQKRLSGKRRDPWRK